MIQTFSHTFTFQTPDSLGSSERFDNIISITEENAIKHYVQYTQYRMSNNRGEERQLHYRQCNIKVDRYYYLEIANIAIDDKHRRSRLFTVLGKRRFGANDNHVDPYLLNQGHDINAIISACKAQQQKKPLYPIRHERIDHAVNKYEAYAFECPQGCFVMLHQENISPRKRFGKSFLLEMTHESYFRLNHIETHESKIEHIFNEIGKIYFKSLPERTVASRGMQANWDDAINDLHRQRFNHEKTATKKGFITLFEQLKDKTTELEAAYFDLYSKSLDLHDSLGDPLRSTLCSAALAHFISFLAPHAALKELVTYFRAVHLFVDDGKLAYLLKKQDSDLQDMYRYALECLSEWNASLSMDDGSTRHFVATTVDLTNALKHFIDSCIEFSHSYKCLDVKPALNVAETSSEEGAGIEPVMDHAIISAKDFFSEVELESEVLDELNELSEEVTAIQYADYIDDELKEGLLTFFEGYVRMLNTFFEFKDLGYSLTLLAQKLSEYDTSSNNDMLAIIMRATVNDILSWKVSVLVEKTAEDIHFIDKSFYSNIAQFDMLFSEPAEMQEDAIEFF